ncbi:MAG: ribosome biogenesis GTP-binding protein YihA/YsxC [Candidatus Absconditabacteria bacterium]|nr:ribosome biogenesis GTP-binding protein YihA/YsxC [Candidatus Absconditabacteria bacterium]
MQIASAQFIKSASKLSECPVAHFPEFALVGRSNVGKSSLINMLTQRKQLAKSSVTPGKTQLLNYFLINESRYLVDLPGYGYAKYSKSQRIDWMDTMQEYLNNRPTLKTVFLLIDGSISAQDIDFDFMQVLAEDNIPFEIIVTKTDKTNQKELHKNITAFQKMYDKRFGQKPELFMTSSTKGRGKDKILEKIEKFL